MLTDKLKKLIIDYTLHYSKGLLEDVDEICEAVNAEETTSGEIERFIDECKTVLLDRVAERATDTSSSQKELEKTLLMMEGCLRTRQYGEVDDWFKHCPPEAVDPAVILGALSITVPAKSALKEREGFLRRAESWLKVKLGETRALALLEHRR